MEVDYITKVAKNIESIPELDPCSVPLKNVFLVNLVDVCISYY